jgi:hypothetical protein
VPSLIWRVATYCVTAGLGSPMMLWPAPLAATTLEAASEVFWNCATWDSGSARFSA